MASAQKKYIIAIDAGTTSVRVVCYDQKLHVVDSAQQEFTQYYPQPGWVEHDAQEIWAVTEKLLNKVLRGRCDQVASIGITNQRETTVVWNARTGKPIHKAIVWQCRRTAEYCTRLGKRKGVRQKIQSKTGLILDAYFSATKLRWLLREYVTKKKAVAQKRGSKFSRSKALADLRFGTIDTWLLWNLTSGEVHATDFTNASRTMLYNIRKHRWDADLLKLFGVPKHVLPEVRNSGDNFGVYKGIPITAMIGDQQSALFGQGGFSRGDAKNTYGTGCFLLMNIGKSYKKSKNGLLTTLTPDATGKPVYALEGSVFIGGAIVQWLRDELQIISNSAEVQQLAIEAGDNHGVYIVPAFAGLGAPYWNQEARGVITGLTRGAGRKHIARAAEEAIAYQVHDLVRAMEQDAGTRLQHLIVDGGATRDDFLMQFQADMLQAVIDRPVDKESTARGAVMMAGLHAGVWKSAAAVQRLQKLDKRFKPKMAKDKAKKLLLGWKNAVQTAQSEVKQRKTP